VSEKPRIVIDTQIYLRAALNRRSSPGQTVFERTHSYQLVISSATRSEIVDVFGRPQILRSYPHLTDAVKADILSTYDTAERVEVEEIPAISRDPKDDIFLATAVAGKADYFVTEDRDLLVLNSYEGIRIITALEFLNVLENPAAPSA